MYLFSYSCIYSFTYSVTKFPHNLPRLPRWCSPEVVTRSSHGLESDVWSLGCMLFIMLVGHPPFDGKGLKESIFTKVVMGEYKVR